MDELTHCFAWGNNPRRAARRGRRCRILARGRLGSVLVEWADGSRDIVSRRALRRLAADPTARAERSASA